MNVIEHCEEAVDIEENNLNKRCWLTSGRVISGDEWTDIGYSRVPWATTRQDSNTARKVKNIF